jgi:hypothetical protein
MVDIANVAITTAGTSRAMLGYFRARHSEQHWLPGLANRSAIRVPVRGSRRCRPDDPEWIAIILGFRPAAMIVTGQIAYPQHG